MAERINKSRYWWAVLYPENMIEDWEDKIADLVQVPFAYCIHDTDTDSKSEHRKDHVHLILVFTNTTTYKHALDVFKLLGDKAVNTCQACVSIRYCYDYLIHDTPACKKQGKHLYGKDERITGNNFDIGAYEQLTTDEQQKMLKELNDFILKERIMNMADFWILEDRNFSWDYYPIAVKHNAMLARTCRGNYLKEQWRLEKKEREHKQKSKSDTSDTDEK